MYTYKFNQFNDSEILIMYKNNDVVARVNINDFETDLKATDFCEVLCEHLETWEDTENPKEKIKKQTKTCYIDTRYKAKLRLYNYITYTKNGLSVTSYKPFEGTEIGKSIPILNF